MGGHTGNEKTTGLLHSGRVPLNRGSGPLFTANGINNDTIANVFDEIASLLELEAANPFRIRAYRNAARQLRALPFDIAARIRDGVAFAKIPGIGADLTAKMHEIVHDGSCALLQRLRQEVTPELAQLLRLPQLGPKRVRQLYHDLGVASLPELRTALEQQQVQQLHGFGPRLEQRLLQTVRTQSGMARRFTVDDAEASAQLMQRWLQSLPGVAQVTVAGSLRRGRDTVGDLDILVQCRAPPTIATHLSHCPQLHEVLLAGKQRSSVVLNNGIQVDLRCVSANHFGSALHYFTGSKAHSIALRRRAVSMGLKLNEYGVFRGTQKLASRSEELVYAALNLPYIEPELREDRGEIEAAERGQLPTLIKATELRGDLHCHTIASDGLVPLAAMAEAAQNLGYEYLAISDHSHALKIAHGLNADALLVQMDAIDALNATLKTLTVLKSVEVEILLDGKLDLPDHVLSRLDLVIGAVHSHFQLPARQQTTRLLRAINSRYFTLLAHPQGRLLLQREPCAFDLDAVLQHAQQRGCWLELNAQPQRLDLNDELCRRARQAGVLIAINSDAHRPLELSYQRYGVTQARRGWLQRDDVVNTRSLDQLRVLLRATMI